MNPPRTNVRRFLAGVYTLHRDPSDLRSLIDDDDPDHSKGGHPLISIRTLTMP